MKTTKANLIGYAEAIIWLHDAGFGTPEQGVNTDSIMLRGGKRFGSYPKEYEVVLRLDEDESFLVSYFGGGSVKVQMEGSGYTNLRDVVEAVEEAVDELD